MVIIMVLFFQSFSNLGIPSIILRDQRSKGNGIPKLEDWKERTKDRICKRSLVALYLRDVDMMIDEIDEELYRGDRRETAINLVYHHVP